MTRTDLSYSQTLPGTLGFGASTPIAGHGTGIITGLANAGQTLSRGSTVYRADDQPVILFYGVTPLFRTLRGPKGAEKPLRGRDVTVVADNLLALGYDIGSRPPDPDGQGDTYTSTLASAVKRWQQHIGLAATGQLGAGQILVLPGQVRVGSIQAHLGDPVTETLMSVTSTAKTVTVPVAAGDDAGIVRGAKVTITLPDNSTVPGTVESIGSTVTSGDTGQGGQNSPPTLSVSVRPMSSATLAALDFTPVQVQFTTGTRHNVLAVPVTALVAVRQGGYALQRADGTLVAVQTGLFAGGQVEVSGSGVTAGMRVETAS